MDSSFTDAFAQAFRLAASLDPGLVEIVGLSLKVSLTAVLAAGLIGLPIGALLALYRFPGRRVITLLVTAFMGMPPVVLGLMVYLMLSRSGPLGVLGLLYTPTAMIIAQTLLVLPIIIALSRATIAAMWREYEETMRSLVITGPALVRTMLFEARYDLATTMLAGFGRAIAEVGAVMIVGGNINHFTRVMTTAIALETSKGDLALALALGVILLTLALAVNLAVHGVSLWGTLKGNHAAA
jgi:tungstate transport system permease protein